MAIDFTLSDEQRALQASAANCANHAVQRQSKLRAS